MDLNKPKNLDPYLEVVVDEFLQLSGGTTLYDAYQGAPFKLKTEILLYVLDYPGLGKVMKMSGSGAYKGCLWCEIKGTYSHRMYSSYSRLIRTYVKYIYVCRNLLL